MIQILTYSGDDQDYKGKDVTVNSLHNAQSLDDFEINIIDLQDMTLWKNDGSSDIHINDEDDLKSLGIMINASNCPVIIILFPQNGIFRYAYSRGMSAYSKQCELKNMIENMLRILSNVYSTIELIRLRYENTRTKISDKVISASFCFNTSEEDVLIVSEKSKRPTVIKCEKVILATLAIESYKDVIALLKEIGIIKEKIDIPEWMEEIKMFDDNKQFEIIQENNDIIRESQHRIDSALKRIERNNRYKSVLYTNGDELVEVVFEIMQEMLGCDLHNFEDKKKEDFSFRREDTIYIGEIKGISSNIKSANITQLELHYRGFLDEHEDINENNIRQLLVIAHQRGLALSERDPVDRKQIELAERNGSLIIETYTLLKLFEKYQAQELTREQCFDLLNGKGLLRI